MAINFAVFRADTEGVKPRLARFRSTHVKPVGFSETLRAINMSKYGLIKIDNQKKSYSKPTVTCNNHNSNSKRK